MPLSEEDEPDEELEELDDAPELPASFNPLPCAGCSPGNGNREPADEPVSGEDAPPGLLGAALPPVAPGTLLLEGVGAAGSVGSPGKGKLFWEGAWFAGAVWLEPGAGVELPEPGFEVSAGG
jgi:hypothetical protein